MLTYLLPVAAVCAIAVYYVLYFAKIKKAGGFAAAGEAYWRDQFGLWPNERVVSTWVGQYYMGPLVPGSMRSGAEKVFDFLSNTTVRGAQVFFCFTDHNRLAIAVEMNEDDDAPKSTTGLPGMGYRPLVAYPAEARPQILMAEQVWPGSPHLPPRTKRPQRRNLMGKRVTMSLVSLADATGARQTLWVEEGWIPSMQQWAQGGPVVVDPQWAPKANLAGTA